MAVLKCKMCGGDLNLKDEMTVAECEYCGTKQTVPTADNEKKMTLFARANRLRAACEFDKSAGIYESIVADFPEEAEAYWGLVLCKFGIEYVDDPATGNKIPTCHRSSFESVMDDPDFEQVMENADSVARKVYRTEAKAIEELRKGIIEVSSKEEPYDIFICYKETDENGERTIDSVIAEDIYERLIQNKYRVFFSRISLEDKLGTAYEPYIFAALNSAKIMLAIGTDYDYYNAVWVKNEWSRFLMLMAKDKTKVLIPCYKDLDAYDIPKEFKHLQAQDMSKVGAMQDLLRGIKKILNKENESFSNSNSRNDFENNENAKIQALLKRVFIFLEDDDWDSADEYCEKILDANPENTDAYLGKLLVEYKAHNIDELSNGIESFDSSKNYKKIVRFGDKEIKKKIENALESATANQAMFLPIINDKWNSIKSSEYYFDILDFIKELLSLNTNSPLITEDISKRIYQATDLLWPKSNNLNCEELFHCFKSLDQYKAINSNYSELMSKYSLKFLEKFMDLSNNRIKCSLDIDELKNLLLIYTDLSEYVSITHPTYTSLKKQSHLCESKIDEVEEMIKEERKRIELVSNLEKELEGVDSQISTIQRNMYNSPEKGQIIKLEKENKRLIAEKESLGTFKTREKKALQEKIDKNNNKIKTLNENDKQNYVKFRKELPGLQKRREKIKTEIENNSKSILK